MDDAQTSDPQDEDALYERARVLQDAGQYAEALPLWQLLTTTWPAADYWMMLSLCLNHLQRWVEMEAAAREALELAPEAGAMWCGLALSLAAQDRHGEAREAYERSVATCDSPYTRVLYAGMLTKIGDVEEARQQLQACTRDFPEFEAAWYDLGSSWEVEDPERALRLMQSALEIDPEEGEYHAGVAYMHARLAHVDEARHHLREARRLGSEYADHTELDGMLDRVSAWLHEVDRQFHPRAKRPPE